MSGQSVLVQFSQLALTLVEFWQITLCGKINISNRTILIRVLTHLLESDSGVDFVNGAGEFVLDPLDLFISESAAAVT